MLHCSGGMTMDVAPGKRPRAILHIDMNAFYCACHAAAEPEKYKGKATAVAGSPKTRHGVVVTASYEARAHGVRATMTVAEAERACRGIILISPDFNLYRYYSKRVFDIVRSFTPLVEVFSIDECYADMTGSHQFGSPAEIAQRIQTQLLEVLHLPASIGIAPNKFLAKMASDMKKPFGLTSLRTEDAPRKLWPLPVETMFGVGAQTAARLLRIGITTIGDLAHYDVVKLHKTFGVRAIDLHRHANGLDDSLVNPHPEQLKSVGHSVTLPSDIATLDDIRLVLLNLADQVGRRVRRHALVGRTVQVTIRFANRHTVTRSRTLASATDLSEDLYHTALALVQENVKPEQTIRLLGVTLTQLMPVGSLVDTNTQAVQLTLFDDLSSQVPEGHPAHPVTQKRTEKLRELTKVTDQLRNRFGEDIVVRGRMLYNHESNQLRNRRIRGTSLQKDDLQ